MKGRKHTPEQIVRKLREGDRILGEGKELAEVAGLTLLHYEADFDQVAEVTGQPTEWAVPRISVL